MNARCWNRWKLLIVTISLLAPQYEIAAKEYKVAFYTAFEPVSYSSNQDPSSPEFNQAKGYEPDLLKAIEAIPGSDMSFKFQGVNKWTDIWLTPYNKPEIDIVIGGIDEEERRKKNAFGRKVVDVTHKTLNFKQSVLMKATDAEKIKSIKDLTCDYTIGVIRDSTEEYRFLLQAGLIANLQFGKLKKGLKIPLENKDIITADGELRIYDPRLKTRMMILPQNCSSPKVKYFDNERVMYQDLTDDKISGIASDSIGNQFEAEKSNGKLAVTAINTLDCPHELGINCDQPEHAVMYIKINNHALQTALNKYIDYLTNKGTLDFADWKANPNIFMERAQKYKATEKDEQKGSQKSGNNIQ